MTLNKLAIAIIAITLVGFNIILPMVNKIQSDFAKIEQTLKNG